MGNVTGAVSREISNEIITIKNTVRDMNTDKNAGLNSGQLECTDINKDNKVVVMLSTYCGEKFLKEQLDSIANQQGDFSIHLKIRDDGSTDNTVAIIEEYKAEMQLHSTGKVNRIHPATETIVSLNGRNNCGFIQSVDTQYGKNIGFKASFFTLLKDSGDEAEWYAFCDQDDVWQPKKLQHAIDMLQNISYKDHSLPCSDEPVSEVPLLYTSRLQLVNDKLEVISLSQQARKGSSFENAMVENIVTGATIVMNRAAKLLLQDGLKRHFQELCDQILLHDWWCYLVISAFGCVIYDKEPFILYRQHESNTIGQKTGFFAKQKRRLQRFVKTGNVHGITKQVALFLKVYQMRINNMPEAKHKVLLRFLDKDHDFFHRAAYAFHPDAIRQTALDSLLMRLLILFHRL